jgi:hypothetical protein
MIILRSRPVINNPTRHLAGSQRRLKAFLVALLYFSPQFILAYFFFSLGHCSDQKIMIFTISGHLLEKLPSLLFSIAPSL